MPKRKNIKECKGAQRSSKLIVRITLVKIISRFKDLV